MKNLISKNILLSLTTITALSLSSCGGGGGTTTPIAQELEVKGKAIDGYLVKSTVCLDLNMDNYCVVDDEPFATTDEHGSFKLTITPEQQKHANFDVAPLLVYGGYDSDKGEGVFFTGKLRAVRGGSVINITPTTTVVEKMVREQNLTHEDAQKAVREMLELPESTDLGEDPMELAEKGEKSLLNANLKLHKSLELMANTLNKAVETTQKANEILDATNKLIDDLYAKLAEVYQKDTTKKIDNILEEVIDSKKFADKENMKTKTKVFGEKLDDFIEKEDFVNSERFGAQISTLQHIIIDGSVFIDDKGKTIIKDEMGEPIPDDFFDDFRVMHGFEILDIIGYNKNDFDKMAKTIADILEKAGMEDKYLPIEKEIEALKSNPETKMIGERFEEVIENIDNIEFLSGKTFWISTKFKDTIILEHITISPNMQEILYVETNNDKVLNKDIANLFFENNTLIATSRIDGDVIKLQITNLKTAKVDGYLSIKKEDVNIKYYFNKDKAIANSIMADENYNDENYNDNSTKIDNTPIITLPDNSNSTTIDDTPISTLANNGDYEDTRISPYLQNLIAGKTIYTNIDNKLKTLEKMTFSKDLSNLSWRNLIGGSCSGNVGLVVDGLDMIATDESNSCEDDGYNDKPYILKIAEVDDKIMLNIEEEAPIRVFFDEEKAKEFYITNAVKNYFTGNTIYYKNENGYKGVRTFNTDGTYSINDETMGTYSISGDTLTIKRDTPNRTLVFKHLGSKNNSEKFSLDITNADGSKLSIITYEYRNEADRDN